MKNAFINVFNFFPNVYYNYGRNDPSCPTDVLSCAVPCEPGTRAKRKRLNAVMRVSYCEDCPAGTVQARYAQYKCGKCPSGTVPNEEKTLCIGNYRQKPNLI